MAKNSKTFTKGDGRAGRKKGSVGKFTSLKDSFVRAFIETGDVDGLVKWIKDSNRNRGQFYTLVARMLPSNVAVEANVKTNLSYEQAMKIKEEVEKEDDSKG